MSSKHYVGSAVLLTIRISMLSAAPVKRRVRGNVPEVPTARTLRGLHPLKKDTDVAGRLSRDTRSRAT
jgi:hypothetical protein